ncbi:hypothetical protein ASPWEDRAFT_103768 [Aspergillus wentii DTO 134E9]|uniref:NADP-dependent oxidoreductase domain-containing protein n=1 Tax=Aspergillus wentii DTO 134E9 TaxID=1073089 RepID=A0A1L9RTB5_ASPWE|nr:uncharacterized protein ASPWEDRAFT_103768 [Aspergillus wentii DTO 134E9]OJJ38123.1 hypothetical protein ASPWEDRAFT_103768 [Aspergillus wentii DTO 134E9]
MSSIPLKVIFGGAVLDPINGNFATVEDTQVIFHALKEEGIDTVDTAQVYGQSESLLGQAEAGLSFTVDTKHCGGHIPGQSTRETLLARAEESLKKLQVDQVNIFYIHSPDRATNLTDTLSAVDELFRKGKFKQFGLSNFLAHEVEEVVRVAKKHGFILPSVFQGSYSAVTRRPETELLPILRKHNISFYAYSPMAGGFLAKSREGITAGQGRWDPASAFGKFNLALFNNAAMLEGLDSWIAISEKWGISQPDLAYRWIMYHSALNRQYGDAVIIGASKVTQLHSTMRGLREGPLLDGAVDDINAMWEIVKGEAVLDPVNALMLKGSSSETAMSET